jgi:tRNA-specific 2-thiouridylase
MRDQVKITKTSSNYAGTDRSMPDGVVLGMSGGVDSSTAALILKEQGKRVIGVTLRFFCFSPSGTKDKVYLYETSIRRSAEICKELEIPHYVVDVERPFKDTVIKDFIEEYSKGRTPNPCVICNEKVKFPALAEVADRLGIDRIATGHYARLAKGEGGRVFLASAVDTGKDQSYFMYRIPVRLLRRSIFPLGTMKKDEVKRLTSRLGLRRIGGKESQDVCFLPYGGLKAFLAERAGNKPGIVVDSQGRILGRHKGISFYTVGQRRGLGISGGVPMYVKSIDARRNRIVLAPEDELRTRSAMCRSVRLRRCSLEGPLSARIRYRHPAAGVERVERGKGFLRVRFRDLQRAVTPGQSIVIYRHGIVMGGGIIEGTGEEEGQ